MSKPLITLYVFRSLKMFGFCGKQDKIVQKDVNIGKGHVCRHFHEGGNVLWSIQSYERGLSHSYDIFPSHMFSTVKTYDYSSLILLREL